MPGRHLLLPFHNDALSRLQAMRDDVVLLIPTANGNGPQRGLVVLVHHQHGARPLQFLYGGLGDEHGMGEFFRRYPYRPN